MDRMLQIEGLTKRFGDFTAVNGISFSVDRGEVLGFLGPNGAGKTTAMRMVTGFLPPTSGTAFIAGHDVTREPIAVKSRIGYLPEGAPLYEDMTPFELLGFDLVPRSYDNAFECSPLWCNRLAEKVTANRFCLLDTAEQAFALAPTLEVPGQPLRGEPGPYHIVEVWRQRPA